MPKWIVFLQVCQTNGRILVYELKNSIALYSTFMYRKPIYTKQFKAIGILFLFICVGLMVGSAVFVSTAFIHMTYISSQGMFYSFIETYFVNANMLCIKSKFYHVCHRVLSTSLRTGKRHNNKCMILFYLHRDLKQTSNVYIFVY